MKLMQLLKPMKPSTMPVKKKMPVFAKSFAELEEIAAWFEQEDVDLDEALQKFERGLELAKACKDKLSEVENKVEQIKKKFGDLETESD